MRLRKKTMQNLTPPPWRGFSYYGFDSHVFGSILSRNMATSAARLHKRRTVESVWGPAVETELYLEGINLRCLAMLTEAATNDYYNLLELRKENRSVKDGDLKHARRLIEVRQAAFDKEYERLMGEHVDEEEALLRLLDQMENPETEDELVARRLAELADSGDDNPWEGLDGTDPDFNPLQPL